VANSVCRSHIAKSVQKVLDLKDIEKKKKYQEVATAKGAKYMTFSCDIYGHMSRESGNFLNSLTGMVKARADPESQSVFTHAATINKFSKALAFGNGNCLLFSHQLRMFGVHLGATPTPIAAPPVPQPYDLTSVVESPAEFFAPPGLEKSGDTDDDEGEDDDATAPSSSAAVSSQAPLARPPPALAPQAQIPRLSCKLADGNILLAKKAAGQPTSPPLTAPAPQAPTNTNTNTNTNTTAATGAGSPVIWSGNLQ